MLFRSNVCTLTARRVIFILLVWWCRLEQLHNPHLQHLCNLNTRKADDEGEAVIDVGCLYLQDADDHRRDIGGGERAAKDCDQLHLPVLHLRREQECAEESGDS